MAGTTGVLDSTQAMLVEFTNNDNLVDIAYFKWLFRPTVDNFEDLECKLRKTIVILWPVFKENPDREVPVCPEEKKMEALLRDPNIEMKKYEVKLLSFGGE